MHVNIIAPSDTKTALTMLNRMRETADSLGIPTGPYERIGRLSQFWFDVSPAEAKTLSEMLAVDAARLGLPAEITHIPVRTVTIDTTARLSRLAP